MEIPWKMQRAGYLLLIIVASIGAPTSSTPVPETSEEPTPEASTESKKDLDLETQDQVAILKQINRVNEDGSYTFGYEAADGSFKIETRDVNGNVKGMFGFINEDGELKRVSYSASNGTGFQTTGAFNVPSLPGTSLSSDEEVDGPYGSAPPQILRQRLFPSNQDTSTRIDLLPPSTTSYDDIRTTELIPTPRLPIYIFSTTPTNNEITTTVRPVVIQHIPKVRPTPSTSTTPEATESEEDEKKTTTFGSFLPKKTSNTNYVTLKTNDVTTEPSESEEVTTKKPSVIQVIRPRTGPFRKVIVTKRPIIETTTPTPTTPQTPKTITTTEFYSNEFRQRQKERNQQAVNGVRRQLDFDNNYSTTPENANLVTSGTEDNPDVYGGSPTPRPYTTVAYRTLFTQIPQHQRILQNSYIQNQNQYLAASFPPGLPPRVNPYAPGQDPARLLPAPPVLPENIPNQPNNFNRPDPQRPNDDADRGFPVPSQPLNRVYPNPIPVQPGYANPAPLQPSPYNAPYNPQLYIPPGLLESLIRMLLSVRAYQQQMISPDPSVIDNRYGPYPQNPLPIASPFPNYSQGPYPYPPQYNTKVGYDPRLQPYPNPYPAGPFYQDPRITNYQAPNPYRPIIYGPYQSRIPFQPNQNPFVLGTFLNGRPPIPNVPNAYSPVVPDSTTSATTSKPRIGSVRNVQILNPNNEDSEESEKFQRDVKL